MKRLTTLLTLTLLCVGTLWAAPLKDKEIRNFIAAMEELEGMEGEFDELLPETEEEDAPKDFSHLLSTAVVEIKDHPAAYQRLENVLLDHGFASVDSWAAIGDRVMHAWMTIEMEQSGQDAKKDIAAALAEIDANPSLSAEQKAQMKASMHAMMGTLASIKTAPEADVKAVSRYINDLRKMGDPEQ